MFDDRSPEQGAAVADGFAEIELRGLAPPGELVADALKAAAVEIEADSPDESGNMRAIAEWRAERRPPN